MISVGKRIAELRRAKGITQDELAEKLNVTAQAVSKWENDLSYPDIMALPKLAQILDITVDELLSGEAKKEVQMLAENERKSIDDLMFRIYVNSARGDKVRVNLPMPLIKVALEMGVAMPEIAGNEQLKNIDLAQILTLVEQGIIGKLVEVESADGDTVEIVVE